MVINTNKHIYLIPACLHHVGDDNLPEVVLELSTVVDGYDMRRF